MKKQTLLKLGLLLILSSMVSACGPSKVTLRGNDDLASRISGEELAGPAEKNISLCNQAASSAVSINTMVYFDQHGQARNEVLRAAVDAISSDFANTDMSIRFFRWKANMAGEVYFDSTPLRLRFEQKSNKTIATGYVNGLNWNEIRNAAAANKIVADDIETFFENYSMVIDLKDPTAEYDAIKIAVYQGSNKITEVDSLIPAFYADPRSYAVDHASILQGLHPFAAYTGTAWNTAHYESQLKAYCF